MKKQKTIFTIILLLLSSKTFAMEELTSSTKRPHNELTQETSEAPPKHSKTTDNDVQFICGICLEQCDCPAKQQRSRIIRDHQLGCATNQDDNVTHYYHTDCLTYWLKKNPKCPECRQRLIAQPYASLNTQLKNAVISDNLIMIQTLLDEGADIEAPLNDCHDTPLLYTAKTNNFTTLKLLLELGANVHADNRYGNTALHLAMRNNYITCSTDLFLSDFPPRPKFVYSRHIMTNLDIIRLLLNNKANVHAKNNEGDTPLHLVTKLYPHHFSLTGIKLLLKHGANIDAQNIYNETVLHQAVRIQNTDLVETLLNLGANASIKNTYEKTALMIANSNKYHKIKTLLQSHNATNNNN